MAVMQQAIGYLPVSQTGAMLRAAIQKENGRT